MATLKQKKAAQKITENHGNVSKGMLEAGYSPNTAKKPSNLTNSKGWQELMDKFLPDSLLAKKHQALLNKEEVRLKNNNETGEIDVIPTGQIDVQAVAKGLEMAYKLKGSYAPEKHEHKIEIDPEEKEKIDNALDEVV